MKKISIRNHVAPFVGAALGVVGSVCFMHAYGHVHPSEQAGPVRYAFGAVVAGLSGFLAGSFLAD
ncbi:hypothetical protein [Paraburkholderia tropica]|uniref:hypothetical protein n=1 Tax=Paraburkholderia tropica TaxID=92647 RepID=UPI002AB711FC|nr:hypothetical protein [Paraburkholderia tropica]